MPNIKPISDLRNYATVLETVQVGKPLYLTKNGRGCYTVMNIDEQEEQREKAEKYDRSGRTNGEGICRASPASAGKCISGCRACSLQDDPEDLYGTDRWNRF